MNCPNCNGPLLTGEAFFKKPLTDLAVFGLGAEDLRMKSDEGEDFLLLSASEKTAVQFCLECGVAVIATEKGRRSAIRKKQG